MSGNQRVQNFRVLIVDDDESTRRLFSSILEAEGYESFTACDIRSAEDLLRREPVHLALLDLHLGATNGLNVLDLVRVLQPQCACVMMTAHTSVETVAKSLGSGATEYLGKPLQIDDLLAVVRKVQSGRRSSSRHEVIVKEGPETAIIGRTPKMLEVYRAIARAAPTEASVLIIGGSGTGKELVARALHEHSPRGKMPFLPVNCGALPENILESELFGHEKGAFTGADSARPGLFEAADGGTLFLDEISETKPSFQVNLLRAVEEKQIRRVGSHKYTPVDVRIVAASNQDLAKVIQQGRFREDLYYRLGVVVINLPDLEERREDIPLLVQHFLKRAALRNNRGISISNGALALLKSSAWPGNVRELENLVERLAIFCTSGQICPADVERERLLVRSHGSDPPAPLTLQDVERQHIIRVLQENGGNKSKAARTLGIERKTLYQKARRLGIDLSGRNVVEVAS